MADIVERITSSGLCHGCGACVAACDKIDMSMTPEGYLRPTATQELHHGDEVNVLRACSGLTIRRIREAGTEYDPTWGPIVSVGTAHATDPELRHRGSSGGVISAIAAYLIETKRVDFIVQTAADPDDPVGNLTRPSRTRADIIAAAGSRYAPSAPLANLEAYLSAGRRFAFVGKPCDIASLRRLARHDRRVDELIPFKLSFFCAGVPSRNGALAVLKELGVSESELTEFSYRGRGWPGLTRAVRADGSEESMTYNASWGSILNRHLQFRCKICPDGTGEAADIACADAWYGNDGYPDFAEREVRSLVMARTAAGVELLEGMNRAGTIVREPLDLAQIRLMQPYQYDRKRAVLARLTAMRLKGRQAPHFRGLALWSLTLRSAPMWLLRNLWGTYQRIAWRGKIV